MNKRFMVACSLVLLLGGCKKFSCKKDGQKKEEPIIASEEILVSANGKPILKLQEFKQYVADATARDQQMAMMAQFMPDFEEKMFEGGAYPRVIFNEWAKLNNIIDKEEYKQERAKAIRVIEDMLNQDHFIKAHVSEVTDADVKKFYDENKDKEPGLMVSAGGVEAKAVKFDKESKAKEFFDKVKAKSGNLEVIAKEVNLKISDLGKVNKMSMVSEAVKNEILGAKSFPSVLPIINDGGKEFLVVKVYKREPVQYRPFDQIKGQLKEHVMAHKMSETIQKVLPDYEKKYGISVNRSYFDRKRQEAEQKMKEMQEATQQKDAKAKPAAKELVQQKAAA